MPDPSGGTSAPPPPKGIDSFGEDEIRTPQEEYLRCREADDSAPSGISCPMPPKHTTNYDYEFNVAIWRQRITDELRAIRRQMHNYRHDEDERHAAILNAIEGRGKAWAAFWTTVRHGMDGGLKLATTIAGNMTAPGNLKWSALIVLGLAAIANGVAMSGLGFGIGTDAQRCGPGTVEVEGVCVPAIDATSGASEG